MTSARIRIGYDREIQKLRFARKLLGAAALIQLALFLPFDVDGVIRRNLFGFAAIAGALLGLPGFVIVYRLSDMRDAQDSVDILAFMGPMKRAIVRAELKLAFPFVFLIPVLNLVVILYAFFKAKSAVRALRASCAEDLQKRAMKDKLTGYHRTK